MQILLINKKGADVKYNSFEACYFGMDSIMKDNLNKKLISTKLIKDLEDAQLKVEKIHLVKAINQFSCDVFTTDPKGVRRFQVSLDKSTRFAHGYMLKDIKERKVTSRYQL